MAKSKSKGIDLMAYWGKHPHYTSFVHTALGVGVGLLLQPFLAGGNYGTIGWALVALGVLGHLYALVA